MLSLGHIVIYLMEGLAIAFSAFLISKKQLGMPELATLALTIAVTFMILDLFAPSITPSVKQGLGFAQGAGLVGFGQLGGDGTSLPSNYYGNASCQGGQCHNSQPTIEGMDDPVAIQYYERYNPPYGPQVFPPKIDTHGLDQNVPRTLEPVETQHFTSEQESDALADQSEGFENEHEHEHETFMDQVPPIKRDVPSVIAHKLLKNPFDTTVRQMGSIELPGSAYGDSQVSALGHDDPVFDSALTPTYGYRYQLPRGWDQLEQPGLPSAFNRFRNNAKPDASCQVGPYGNNGQYNPNYKYTAKNM